MEQVRVLFHFSQWTTRTMFLSNRRPVIRLFNMSFIIKVRFNTGSNMQKIQPLMFSLRVISLYIKHGMLLYIKIWWMSRLSGCHPLLWTLLIYILLNKLLLTLTIFKTNIIFITEFSVKWMSRLSGCHPLIRSLFENLFFLIFLFC